MMTVTMNYPGEITAIGMAQAIEDAINTNVVKIVVGFGIVTFYCEENPTSLETEIDPLSCIQAAFWFE